MNGVITMAHGDGGEAAHRLVRELILPAFAQGASGPLGDAALMPGPEGRIAVTTDSFVIKPLFFPGGNIGKLAVAGTVNDLAVSGAVPLYMTVAFILEEGFPLSELRLIAESMGMEAARSGVALVAGDTKVVEKGSCDGIYINTTGIGAVPGTAPDPLTMEEGDAVIVTGTVGDHGTAILAARNELGFVTGVQSDCASLSVMLQEVCRTSPGVRIMRDPTRGGLATALVEICEDFNMTVELDESLIPVQPGVEGACELFGFDPLYLANEGKAVIVVSPGEAPNVLSVLRNHEEGREAALIGRVTAKGRGQLLLRTSFGATRRLFRLTGTMLPRIC